MIGLFADPRQRLGLPPEELWGVAQRDLCPPKHGTVRRGEKARARRRAKRAAASRRQALKAYLREVQP